MSGVSVATVSRTLSRPEKVAESTRKKVLQAVEKSGYVTNVLASNFRRRKSQSIVVLVPDIANPFYSRIIQEIESVARDHGYQILLGETRQDPEMEKSYGNLAQRRLADGIIGLGMHIPFKYRPTRKTIDPKWPPLVMACEYTGDIPVPTIAIDNRGAARDATRYLIELGHIHIAYIGGPPDFSLSRDRLKGFRTALSLAGLKSPEGGVHSGDFSLQAGYGAAQRLLSQSVQATAIFCASDELAMGAMRAAQEQGLRVPRDLSIVGFDDIEMAAFSNPPLTTVRQPCAEFGRRATQMMLQILEGKTLSNERVVLPHELVVRESTARPGGRSRA